MFQANKLLATQAKAIETAKVLAQLTIKNAKAVAEIQYDVARDVASTAHPHVASLCLH